MDAQVQIFGVELGSWGELLGALASIAAAVVSILALRTAIEAGRASREAARTADAMLVRDEERERASVARQLQAWWGTWKADGASHFGVVVSNAGEGASVFREIDIFTTGNELADDKPIHLETLPPGSYVFRSRSRADDKSTPWDEIRWLAHHSEVTPLTYAKRWAVTKMSFTDPLGKRWDWTLASGLTPRTSLRDT